jgi:signal transduction histidine kinase
MHIVYNLVTQTLRGTIAAKTPVRGTRFTIRFPIHMPNAAEAIEAV